MPNPSPLHDPMAKLFFPTAPLVPQLRRASEEQTENPDQYGYSWDHVLKAAADRIEELEQTAVRSKRLMAQIMKTWDPPLLTGSERPADIAQTSTMIAIAYIMGREFLPTEMTDNQRAAIDSGLEFYKQFFGE